MDWKIYIVAEVDGSTIGAADANAISGTWARIAWYSCTSQVADTTQDSKLICYIPRLGLYGYTELLELVC